MFLACSWTLPLVSFATGREINEDQFPITPHSHVIWDLQSFPSLKEEGKRENPLQDIDRQKDFLFLLKMVPVGILWLVLHLCVISLEPLYESMMRHFLFQSEPVALCSLEEQTRPSSPHLAEVNLAEFCHPTVELCSWVEAGHALTAQGRVLGSWLKQRVQVGQHHAPIPVLWPSSQTSCSCCCSKPLTGTHPPANHLIWVRCGSCS